MQAAADGSTMGKYLLAYQGSSNSWFASFGPAFTFSS